MAKTFLALTQNVQNEVNDTSDPMGSIIGVYINNRYKRCRRKINVKHINEDYQVSVIAGTQDYTLPTDFDKEMYAHDRTNKRNLVRRTIENFAEDHPEDLNTQDNGAHYDIFTNDAGNLTLRIMRSPANSFTLDLPYQVKFTLLSAETDEPILELDDVIEKGAIADAWRYKKQFAKAQTFEVEFNLLLADWIFDQYNQINQTHQFNPDPYSRDIV